MNRSKCTAVAYIRQRRKCCFSADILLLLFSMTILFCQNINATSISSVSSSTSLFNNDKPERTQSTHVKSVEWQQMETSTDVVIPEQHPVVYKEDYVKQRKDFDETNLDAIAGKNQKQLTKHIKAASPYQIDSHVIPHAVAKISADNMAARFKLNATELQVTETFSKQQLNKTPKKYFAALAHKRTRRNSEQPQHIVKKRNPYIQQHSDSWPTSNHVGARYNGYAYYTHKSHPVQGNYWNGIDGVVPTTAPQPFFIGQRVGSDDEDRVVWERFRPAAPSLGSIFHDSNPANADTSFLTRRPQTATTRTITTTTTTTQRPPTFGSIFHDSNPANADLSFLRRQTTQVAKSLPQPQQQQLRSGIEAKNDNILFRSSPVHYADDEYVYTDADENEAQRATASEDGICAFALVSCCQHSLNLRLKCFSDWSCKLKRAEIEQKCN